jgi:hypothetical protein
MYVGIDWHPQSTFWIGALTVLKMDHTGTPQCIYDDKETHEERLLYLNFDVLVEKASKNPKMGDLSAKRLGEGGTQAFDSHKYSIHFMVLQGSIH